MNQITKIQVVEEQTCHHGGKGNCMLCIRENEGKRDPKEPEPPTPICRYCGEPLGGRFCCQRDDD